MSYKIVINTAGDVVCYGPDTEGYDPFLKNGETLTIESGKKADDLIAEYQAKQLSIEKEIANKKAALFERLGITAEEAALLLS